MKQQRRKSSRVKAAAITGGRWQIQLLGGLHVRNGDRVVDRFASQYVIQLLASLALEPERDHARDELIDRLWRDEADTGKARNRLRNALSHLQTSLRSESFGQAGVVLVKGDTLRLNLDVVDCDVVAFQAHLKHGRLEAARACYFGELLPGIRAEWLQEHRQRLENQYRSLLGDEQAFDGLDDDKPLCGTGARVTVTVPVTAIEEPRRRLPSYRTNYFGREDEIQRLMQAVMEHRLVTVTGVGGCGKTRLCVQSAERLRRFSLATMVRLEECGEADAPLDCVRAALDLPLGAPSILQQVVASLEGSKALLILDNLEQLVNGPGPTMVRSLLEQLLELHLLVSSRCALQLPGEHEHALQPLPLPDEDASPDQALRNPGVALFQDRARGARGDFNVHAHNVRDIVALCRFVEGVPLAIELAAARVRTHRPKLIREALAIHDWSVLSRTGLQAQRAGRHESVSSTITWSWSLLNAQQQAMLASMTVFRGGWTVPEAAALLRLSPLDCQAALAELVRMSLVQTKVVAPGCPRFQMLQSVRDVVAAHLSAEHAIEIRVRHRTCFLAQARRQQAEPQAFDETVLPNCLHALTTAVEDRDVDTAVALSLALRAHWEARGCSPDTLAALRRVARQATPTVAGHVDLLCLMSRLLLQTGQAEPAREFAAQALQYAGRESAPRARALLADLNVRWRTQPEDPSVLEPAREAMMLARAAGSVELQARAGVLLGAITLMHLRQSVAARDWFAGAQALCAASGDPFGALAAVPGLVSCLLAERRHEMAIALALEGMEQSQQLRHVETQMLLFNRLGTCHEAQRQFARAVSVYRRQTLAARRHGMAYHLAFGMWNQCEPLSHLSRPKAAAVLMAFSQRYWLAHFGELTQSDHDYIERVRKRVGRKIGEESVQHCWERGLTMTLGEGLDLACASAPKQTRQTTSREI